MEYRLIPVTDTKSVQTFHDVPRIIYRNDKNYICPPDDVVEGVFTPAKNVFFNHGEATRWNLLNEAGQACGRVAAFINTKKAYTFQVPTGGMGFFECVQDYTAAELLFETCRLWLEARGMKAMDGPINFGENDNFWGLLVEGFIPQSFGMNYNPPYYREFFERYGFTLYFEQVTNLLNLRKPFPERFWKIADWVRQKPEYQFRHFSYDESEKFISDFLEVYNDAWQFHENFTPAEPEAIRVLLNDMKSLLIPEFIWFAYRDGEPIAFEVMLPDLNQMFRFFNGKINLFGKIRIALAGKKRIFTRSRITIMGVKPHYQKSGIESALFWHMNEVMKKHPQYSEVELSWVGDFNPKMRMLHESVGATFSKRHYTYRKYFEAIPEASRSTIIPVDTREKVIGGA
jgi:GNAT superfamily N-acetyltransferase